MDILLLGGDGMLGHKIFQELSDRFPATACTIRGSLSDERHRNVALLETRNVVEGVDASDTAAVERLLLERQPKVVVNCIGIVKQRSEAQAAIPSITINSLLPHRLANTCTRWGGRLIHFSTDCVFSGKRGAYTETDLSDAEDLYGKTKFLGEVATANALTLRTSIIGRELYNFKSLLEWLLSQNHGTVRGYKRALYSGVTTNYMAKVVTKLIVERPDLSGLYQVTGPTITKYDLLQLLRQAFQLDIEIEPDDTYFCDRSMKGDSFQKETGYICPSWAELTQELASDTTPYAAWR